MPWQFRQLGKWSRGSKQHSHCLLLIPRTELCFGPSASGFGFATGNCTEKKTFFAFLELWWDQEATVRQSTGGETSKVCFSPRFNNLTSCPRGEDLAYQLNLGWANVFPALWKQPVVDALVHPRPYKTQRAKLALNSKNGLTCNTGELKESNSLIKRHFHCTNTKPQCFLWPLKAGRAFKR